MFMIVSSNGYQNQTRMSTNAHAFAQRLPINDVALLDPPSSSLSIEVGMPLAL
ncbi:hypothetical protein NEUTE1DRAFT_118511 [Neurospora tetrasperma FGSC 2508]|uniref:Uncharacterized protein n=1 Tax=Neurospora tetrasperma (strain FGSC 2508 / ATCC MYA-4615 / P0657) TaxID=510951 RepID=F8N3C7_NEUT8|nr:uncharacterized protein NEUTE1DRAFT_118511 [Neurospora tetrasperma FGSC 2508]EGO51734.1 hypothetical protein NEUTE1DRAFT_118511 [Neurospora tetrasperma FGSC 2508]